MFVTKSRTFRWDWLEAAEGCAEVIGIERRKDGLGWPAIRGLPYLAKDPDNPRRYRYVRPWKPPKRLFGSAADILDVRHTVKVLEYLEQQHGTIDVAHVHFYAAARFMPEVKARTGIPYVITEHSTALTLESPDKAVDERGLRLARRAYSEAAAVLPVSRSLQRAIAERGLSGRFLVVDNPVDVSLFRPSAEQREGQDFRLVSVARLAKVKGFDVLLTAMDRVREAYPNVQLTVIGKGPCESELLQLRDRLGLEGCVGFEGHRSRPEIAEQLRRSDLFVLASHTENLPVAVIEAMASGLPIAATDVGGLAEMVDPSIGRLVPPGDPRALAESIVSMLENLDTYDSRTISQRAHERFSFEAASDALDAVYRDASRTA